MVILFMMAGRLVSSIAISAGVRWGVPVFAAALATVFASFPKRSSFLRF
jgi:hypothetical protein